MVHFKKSFKKKKSTTSALVEELLVKDNMVIDKDSKIMLLHKDVIDLRIALEDSAREVMAATELNNTLKRRVETLTATLMAPKKNIFRRIFGL